MLGGPALPLLPAPILAFAQGGEAGPTSTTDLPSQVIVGAIIVTIFVLLALERVHRLLVVIGAVALIWGITYLTPFHLINFDESTRALDFNVLFLLAAMMAVVGVLKTTGVFGWAVARIMAYAAGDAHLLLVVLTGATALLSAFADNVTTVIFIAPMALQMARTIGVAPAAYLLPVVMASNIGGTATLIGDPPNIMIGSGANLTFVDFLVTLAPPVAVMALVLPALSARYYRRDFAAAREAFASRSVAAAPPAVASRAGASRAAATAPPIVDPQLLRWGLGISALIFLGFFTHGLTGMPSSVPATIGAGALLVVQDVLYLRRTRSADEERRHGLLEVIEHEIEWPTLCFFGFLFIAVGAAVQTGLIDTLAVGLGRVVREGSDWLGLGGPATLLFAALLIAWVSAMTSAVVDNIPFVAVMIPIVHRLTAQMPGDSTILWWALALGACLGGNATAVGASANVTALGIAERAGVRITFTEFTRFGSLVALVTLLISSLYLTTRVYLGGRASLLWVAVAVTAAGSRALWLLVRRGRARKRLAV
ncbi:MAG: ArsB/NhaD family transporter [Gemmatimonadaceae bacterium]